jgi:hypothetical protein
MYGQVTAAMEREDAMRRWLRLGVVAAMVGICAAARAQSDPGPVATPQILQIPPPPSQPQGGARPEGTVTGTVTCSDTQTAARFAMVALVPVEQASGGEGRMFGAGGSARTDLEGNFALTGVAAGDYYVAASATGYISALDVVRAAASAGVDESSALAALPQVHVTGGSNSSVSVVLSRGSVLAGRLVWDDGSPASGIQVAALVQPTDATKSMTPSNRGGFGFGGAENGLTDDRGQFRLSGLMPGVYLVRASVEVPMSGPSTRGFTRGFALMMYAPGKIRKTDAVAVTIGQGEERDDAGFTLSLQGLHTVSGVLSAVSGPSVLSGTVRLVDTTDSTLSRTAQVGEDGAFKLTYVPAGSYTLTATGSTTAASSSGYSRGGRGGSSSSSSGNFQAFSESLSVTDSDVTGLGIELTPGSPR